MSEAQDTVIWRKDLCQKIGVCSETMRRWVKDGKIPKPDVESPGLVLRVAPQSTNDQSNSPLAGSHCPLHAPVFVHIYGAKLHAGCLYAGSGASRER